MLQKLKISSDNPQIRYDLLFAAAESVAAQFGLKESDVEPVVIQNLVQLVKQQYLDSNAVADVDVYIEKNAKTKTLEFYTLENNERKYLSFDQRRREANEFLSIVNSSLDSLRATREYEAFSKKKGTIVKGTVEREQFAGYVIDLGKFDKFRARGFISKNETINNNLERSKFSRAGETMLFYLSEIKVIDSKSATLKRADDFTPRIMLSRVRTEFLGELLKMHCYEIQDGIVEIKKIAREPGVRAKVAVTSNKREIDPVGSCVGPHGTRIKPIKEELSDERIDIIHWDPDLETFIRRMLEPAHVTSCTIHNPATMDSKMIAEVIISEGRERAIGKGGVNARLASYLADCRINILEKPTLRGTLTATLSKLLQNDLGIDEELTALLMKHGYSSAFTIACAGVERIEEIPDIDQELAVSLFERAANHEYTGIQRLVNEFNVKNDLIYHLQEKNMLYMIYNLLEFDINDLGTALTSYRNARYAELHGILSQIFE